MSQTITKSITKSSTARRGRPPGTGKNDTDRLLKIAALMAADPALKPTTAIKQIGETDPSTIRRLRDKLHEQQAQLVNGLCVDDRGVPHTTRSATTTVPTGATVHIHHEFAAPSTDIAQRVAPLLASSPKRTAPVLPTANVAIAPQRVNAVEFVTPDVLAQPVIENRAGSAPIQDPLTAFGKWFGNGIETAAMVFEHQMMFAQTMLKAAPMKAIWRQQIVATEYLLMLSGPGQRIGQTSIPTSTQ
jgi:hypothetical protein